MTVYNELHSIFHPIYVALTEFVHGQITVDGNITRFSFELTDDQQRYIVVDICPNHRHLGPFTSVTELLHRLCGSAPKLHLVQLENRYKTMPPMTLQDLLDNQYNLDLQVLKSLKLVGLIMPTCKTSVSRDCVQKIQDELSHNLDRVRERLYRLERKKRVLKACLNANADLLPPEQDSPEYERACKILVSRLQHKGWKPWENSQQQWTLLNQQYKLATHQMSYPEFCCKHVNGLTARREWLQFNPDYSIFDKQVNDYVVIYYLDAFSRLDFSYQKAAQKAAEEWDSLTNKYSAYPPFELKQQE